MNRILLIGRNGQIGWELQRSLAPLGKIVAPDRQEMNLADPDSIRAIVRDQRPKVIINAAAYTAVDKAETETELAMAINGTAPGILAEEAKQNNALLIHYSTDYVFDGEKQAPYLEEDIPNPLNAYGRTKLAGEQAIQAVGGTHLILRTSWVYGARGRNFLLTILRLVRERSELKIVNDQIGTPTWSRLLAEATAQLLARIIPAKAGSSSGELPAKGVFHLAGSGQTTWFGFAEAIQKMAGRLLPGTAAKIHPISTAEYPLPAKRPRYSVLSNRKVTNVFGLALPSWESMLELCLEEMQQS